MNVQPLADGSLLALYRSRWPMPSTPTRSRDGATGARPSRPGCPTTTPRSSSWRCATAIWRWCSTRAMPPTAAMSGALPSRRHRGFGGQRRVARAAGIGTRHRLLGRAARAAVAGHFRGRRAHGAAGATEIGDGYRMTNNSADQRNREYSYPPSWKAPTARCISPSPTSASASSTWRWPSPGCAAERAERGVAGGRPRGGRRAGGICYIGPLPRPARAAPSRVQERHQ